MKQPTNWSAIVASFGHLSHEFLSLKAKAQARDKHGRFIRMHSVVRWPDSGGKYHWGSVTGIDPEGIHVKSVHGDGTSIHKPKELEVVKALIPHNSADVKAYMPSAPHTDNPHKPDTKFVDLPGKPTEAPKPDTKFLDTPSPGTLPPLGVMKGDKPQPGHKPDTKFVDLPGKPTEAPKPDTKFLDTPSPGTLPPLGVMKGDKPVSHVDTVKAHLNDAGVPHDKVNPETHLTPIEAHEDTKDPWGEPLYVDTAGFKKVGGQSGSNQGGIFEGPDGTQYYVKKAQTEQHAANELLSARMYQEAGITVPDVYLTEWSDGSPAIASKIVPNLSKLYPGGQNSAETLAKGREGFSVDAWLANWDSIGLEYDNMMKDAKGNAVRVDTGGSLLYRAQGSPKGGLFGDTVGEVKTLRDKNMNPQAAKIFGGMTDAAIKQDIQDHVDKVDLNKVDNLIDELPFSSPQVKQELKDRIAARKADLHQQFGVSDDKPIPVSGPEGQHAIDLHKDPIQLDTKSADDFLKNGPKAQIPQTEGEAEKLSKGPTGPDGKPLPKLTKEEISAKFGPQSGDVNPDGTIVTLALQLKKGQLVKLKDGTVAEVVTPSAGSLGMNFKGLTGPQAGENIHLKTYKADKFSVVTPDSEMGKAAVAAKNGETPQAKIPETPAEAKKLDETASTVSTSIANVLPGDSFLSKSGTKYTVSEPWNPETKKFKVTTESGNELTVNASESTHVDILKPEAPAAAESAPQLPDHLSEVPAPAIMKDDLVQLDDGTVAQALDNFGYITPMQGLTGPRAGQQIGAKWSTDKNVKLVSKDSEVGKAALAKAPKKELYADGPQNRPTVKQPQFAEHEIQSLDEYTGEDYTYINNYLRGGEVDSYSYWDEAALNNLVDTMDAAIDKSVIQKDAVVYRGSNKKDVLPDNAAPGMILSDTAYLSTAGNIQDAKNFTPHQKTKAVLMEIHVPAGAHAIDVDKTHASKGEDEFIFPRGTQIQIREMGVQSDGTTYVIADVLPEGPHSDAAKQGKEGLGDVPGGAPGGVPGAHDLGPVHGGEPGEEGVPGSEGVGGFSTGDKVTWKPSPAGAVQSGEVVGQNDKTGFLKVKNDATGSQHWKKPEDLSKVESESPAGSSSHVPTSEQVNKLVMDLGATLPQHGDEVPPAVDDVLQEMVDHPEHITPDQLNFADEWFSNHIGELPASQSFKVEDAWASVMNAFSGEGTPAAEEFPAQIDKSDMTLKSFKDIAPGTVIYGLGGTKLGTLGEPTGEHNSFGAPIHHFTPAPGQLEKNTFIPSGQKYGVYTPHGNESPEDQPAPGYEMAAAHLAQVMEDNGIDFESHGLDSAASPDELKGWVALYAADVNSGNLPGGGDIGDAVQSLANELGVDLPSSASAVPANAQYTDPTDLNLGDVIHWQGKDQKITHIVKSGQFAGVELTPTDGSGAKYTGLTGGTSVPVVSKADVPTPEPVESVSAANLTPGDKVHYAGKDWTVSAVNPVFTGETAVQLEDEKGIEFEDHFEPSDFFPLISKAAPPPAPEPAPEGHVLAKDLAKGDEIQLNGDTWKVVEAYHSSSGQIYVDAITEDGKYTAKTYQPGDAIPKAGTPAGSPESPGEPVTGGIPTGTLVPGSDHVYTDSAGKQFVVTKAGHVLRVGDKVTSTKDGYSGTIVQLEKGPKYIKVQGPDGKVKGRQMDSLVPAHAAPSETAPTPKPSATDFPNTTVQAKGSSLTSGDTLYTPSTGEPIGTISHPIAGPGGSIEWQLTKPDGSKAQMFTMDHSTYTAVKAPEVSHAYETHYAPDSWDNSGDGSELPEITPAGAVPSDADVNQLSIPASVPAGSDWQEAEMIEPGKHVYDAHGTYLGEVHAYSQNDGDGGTIVYLKDANGGYVSHDVGHGDWLIESDSAPGEAHSETKAPGLSTPISSSHGEDYENGSITAEEHKDAAGYLPGEKPDTVVTPAMDLQINDQVILPDGTQAKVESFEGANVHFTKPDGSVTSGSIYNQFQKVVPSGAGSNAQPESPATGEVHGADLKPGDVVNYHGSLLTVTYNDHNDHAIAVKDPQGLDAVLPQNATYTKVSSASEPSFKDAVSVPNSELKPGDKAFVNAGSDAGTLVTINQADHVGNVSYVDYTKPDGTHVKSTYPSGAHNFKKASDTAPTEAPTPVEHQPGDLVPGKDLKVGDHLIVTITGQPATITKIQPFGPTQNIVFFKYDNGHETSLYVAPESTLFKVPDAPKQAGSPNKPGDQVELSKIHAGDWFSVGPGAKAQVIDPNHTTDAGQPGFTYLDHQTGEVKTSPKAEWHHLNITDPPEGEAPAQQEYPGGDFVEPDAPAGIKPGDKLASLDQIKKGMIFQVTGAQNKYEITSDPKTLPSGKISVDLKNQAGTEIKGHTFSGIGSVPNWTLVSAPNETPESDLYGGKSPGEQVPISEWKPGMILKGKVTGHLYQINGPLKPTGSPGHYFVDTTDLTTGTNYPNKLVTASGKYLVPDLADQPKATDGHPKTPAPSAPEGLTPSGKVPGQSYPASEIKVGDVINKGGSESPSWTKITKIDPPDADGDFPYEGVSVELGTQKSGWLFQSESYPVKGDPATAPATPTEPASLTGTLVPGSTHVYKDAQGKYVITKKGYVLREGMQVVSTKDGHAGTIKLLELKAQYAKVKGPDGTVKGRQIDTLKPVDPSAQKVTPGTVPGQASSAPSGGIKPTDLKPGDKVSYKNPTTGEVKTGKVISTDQSVQSADKQFIMFQADDGQGPYGSGEYWLHVPKNDTTTFSKSGSEPSTPAAAPAPSATTVNPAVTDQPGVHGAPSTTLYSMVNTPGPQPEEVAGKSFLQAGTKNPQNFQPGDIVGNHKQVVEWVQPYVGGAKENRVNIKFKDQAQPLTIYTGKEWAVWEPTLPGAIGKKKADSFQPGDVVGVDENHKKLVKSTSEWGDTPGHIEVLFQGDSTWSSIPEDTSWYQWPPGTSVSTVQAEEPAGPVAISHDPIPYGFDEGGHVQVPPGGSLYTPQWWSHGKPILTDGWGNISTVDPATGELKTAPAYYGSPGYLPKSDNLLLENTNQADVTPSIDAALGEHKATLISELEAHLADTNAYHYYDDSKKSMLKLLQDPSGDSLSEQEWQQLNTMPWQGYGFSTSLPQESRDALQLEIQKAQKQKTGTYFREWSATSKSTQYFYDANQRKALASLGLSPDTQAFVTTKNTYPNQNTAAAAEIHAAVSDPANGQIIDDLYGHGTAAGIVAATRGSNFKEALSGVGSPYAKPAPALPETQGKNFTSIFLGDTVIGPDGQGGKVVLVTPDGKIRVRRSDGSTFTKSAKNFVPTSSPVTSTKPATAPPTFTAKPRPAFELPDWTKPNPAGVATLPEALAKIKESAGAGNVGMSFAAGGSQVEDLDVRVSRVLDPSGKEVLEVKFKLTPKQGDAMFKRHSADPGWDNKTIQVKGRQVTSETKLAQLTGSHSYTGSGGRTFTKKSDGGVEINFHRANNKTMAMHGSNPVAFHNMVQIYMPADSSPADISKAMYDAGVDKPQPALAQDFLRLGENRLLALFGGKTNAWVGNDSINSSTRETLLADIKSMWGVEAKDLGVAHGANGRIELRLPQEVADKIRAKTKVNYTVHSLYGGTDALKQLAKGPHQALLSTTVRRTEGVKANGMSPGPDIHSGGADYLFAHPRQTLAPLHGLVFDTSRLFQRMDFFTRSGDTYGTHGPNMNIIQETNPSAHEIMFKHRLSMDDAVGYVVHSSSERNSLIADFKAAGVTTIGSRKLEDFFILNPGTNATSTAPQVPVTVLSSLLGDAK